MIGKRHDDLDEPDTGRDRIHLTEQERRGIAAERRDDEDRERRRRDGDFEQTFDTP
jgi:hypothetical protein